MCRRVFIGFCSLFIMKRGVLKDWRIVTDIVISLIIVVLVAIFLPPFFLLISFILICTYLFLAKQKSAIYHLLVSFVIAVIWVIIARNYYSYNQKNLVLLGINLYPLFAWALGLFGAYIIYCYWGNKLKEENSLGRIFLFSAFYWLLLIVGEVIAYNFFNIHDLATSMYSALPLCNCMHAPIWIQASYFALGPLYFLFCDLFNLENRNFKI